MKRSLSIAVECALLWCACATVAAQDKTGPLEKLQEGLNYVREKAGDILGVSGKNGDKPPAFTFPRKVSQRYPAGDHPSLSVTNQFGKVTVSTWTEQVVQIDVTITVGADGEETAQRIAKAINIDMEDEKGRIAVESRIPDTRNESALHGIVIDYLINIPVNAAIHVENFFGDTVLSGVRGAVSVDAQFGVLALQDIGGTVEVRSRGDFPVKVSGLAKGGSFQLHGSPSEFSKVAGKLQILNTHGEITIKDLLPEAELDISSESGPINLVVGPNADPDLTATLYHGALKTDLPMEQTTIGACTVARNIPEDLGPKYGLTAWFAPITIIRTPYDTITSSSKRDSRTGRAVKDSLPAEEMSLPEDAHLVIDTTIGDIQITGADDDRLKVVATRRVWVDAPPQAAAALESLKMAIVKDGATYTLTTTAPKDIEALGCNTYRVDLVISCPRTTPVTINAREGATTLNGLGGDVFVTQQSGSVTAEHIKGATTLINKRGDVSAENCAGPVEAEANKGRVELKSIFGKMTVRGIGGKIIIETPHGEIFARGKGDDVRILALEGFGGDCDIQVEDGNLSILLPPEADANLSLKATNGVVRTAIPLDGQITKNVQEFHARLKEGKHRIQLESFNGDIELD